MGNIFVLIVEWFRTSAEWIVDHLGDPEIAKSLRADLGLKDGQEIPAAIKGQFAQYAAGLDTNVASITDTLEQVFNFGPDLKALGATLDSGSASAHEIAYILLQLAATDSIRLRAPGVFALARAALFVEQDTESLITLDPARLLRAARGEDLPDSELLVQRLAAGGSLALQLLSLIAAPGPNAEKPGHFDVFSGWDLSPDSTTPKADLVSTRATTFLITNSTQQTGGLLVTLIAVPRAHGGPGLFVALGGSLSLTTDAGSARVRLDAGFPSAFDAFIPFGDSPTRLTVQSGDTAPFLTLSVANGTSDNPAFRLGEPTGTRLDIYKTVFGIELTKQRLGVRFGLEDAELVVAAGSANGFLKQIVGDGARVRFSFGFTADTDGGFRLDGGTNARVSLPIGRAIAGALTVHSLDLALGPSSTGGDLGLEVSGAFGASLGPFAASVDRLGFRLDVDRRDNGNLGPLHLDLGFKPPSGIGLSLDTGCVKGGGYLFSDPLNNEYAGALELKFGRVSIKAIGILTDGADGWSLLLMLYGQMSGQPNPGWTLYGIGGIIGLQRGMDLVKLGAAMKTKAFDDILFPENPVADAPRIINELRSFFPFSARSLTIGPMVDIGWGKPRILFIRVAVVIQINDVFHRSVSQWSLARIALIGQLRLQLGATTSTNASSSSTVVKLIVDILGFWDLEKKSYGFLARLRDSKIGSVDITGSLAVYGEYGEKSQFFLAAGGFHPKFKDVPAEAKGAVDRLGASLKVGGFSLRLTGYFALTPATIQTGFNITASATFGPIGLKGELGFDALIYREPRTYFVVDFKFLASITYSGHNLAGVKVTGTLEGPGAWRLKGKFTFSILWWDIPKSFDEKWGSAPAPVPAPLTNVQALLAAEAARRDNWSTELAPGAEPMVTLAPRVGDGSTMAHPLARVAFSQTVVPLGLTLQKFGDTRIQGTARFDVTVFSIGGKAITTRVPVREQFARAQFIEMSDHDKLTKPSFEAMDAGFEFSSPAFRMGAPLLLIMEYETVYLDIDPIRPGVTRPELALARLQPSYTLVQGLASDGAAARTPLRDDERMRAKTAAQVGVGPAPLTVVDRSTFAVDPALPLAGQGRTAGMIAEQRFKPADTTRSQLIEEYELVAL